MNNSKHIHTFTSKESFLYIVCMVNPSIVYHEPGGEIYSLTQFHLNFIDSLVSHFEWVESKVAHDLMVKEGGGIAFHLHQ